MPLLTTLASQDIPRFLLPVGMESDLDICEILIMLSLSWNTCNPAFPVTWNAKGSPSGFLFPGAGWLLSELLHMSHCRHGKDLHAIFARGAHPDFAQRVQTNFETYTVALSFVVRITWFENDSYTKEHMQMEIRWQLHLSTLRY